MRRLSTLAIALVCGLAACTFSRTSDSGLPTAAGSPAVTQDPSASPPVSESNAAVVLLPDTDTPSNLQAARSGRLAGDAALDGGCVWLENALGERQSVVWPPGYGVRFHDAGFDLLAANGGVVAAAGDTVSLGGGVGSDRKTRCDVDGSAEPFVAGSVEVEGPPRKSLG